VTTFGFIGEGITDRIVIENILIGYFADQEEEPVVNPLQPPWDQTGQNSEPPPGGWTLIFRYFEQRKHEEALQYNDYLIVHIDTDVSEDAGYDIPWQDGGRALSAEELVGRVIAKLKGLMGKDFCTLYGNRILFAVAVHGIECWLLPLYFTNKKAAKITGCVGAVNDERRKKGEAPLSTIKNKFPASYKHASREYCDRKKLMKRFDKNPSLRLFIKELESLHIKISAESR
jgi:hypothetical protein